MSEPFDYYGANKQLAEMKRKVELERDTLRAALESARQVFTWMGYDSIARNGEDFAIVARSEIKEIDKALGSPDAEKSAFPEVKSANHAIPDISDPTNDGTATEVGGSDGR